MKHKIEIRQYEHTCGDGCCNDYGYEVIMNDELIGSAPFEDVSEVLHLVLKKLGVDAEVSVT